MLRIFESSREGIRTNFKPLEGRKNGINPGCELGFEVLFATSLRYLDEMVDISAFDRVT